GVSFYKVGIGMLELTDGRYEQPDLFNQNPNDPTLMEVFDALNHRYGTNTLFLGSQGIDRRFEMRRELLTPQYTTCWKDLPK
ncbi:DUF4113 domain-containing protein, partial [Vibrio parahaemolyticus]